MFGDREVIDGGERSLAELGKPEPRDRTRSARDDERTPFYEEGRALAGRFVGQLGKGAFERVVRWLAGRVMIDRPADQAGKAIIAPAVELEHVELVLEQANEREKELALQAVFVEPVRCKVGRRHDHDPGVEDGDRR